MPNTTQAQEQEPCSASVRLFSASQPSTLPWMAGLTFSSLFWVPLGSALASGLVKEKCCNEVDPIRGVLHFRCRTIQKELAFASRSCCAEGIARGCRCSRTNSSSHADIRLARSRQPKGFLLGPVGVCPCATGLAYWGLAPASMVQGDLWTQPDTPRSKALMRVMDGINQTHGRETIRLAGSGIHRGWKLRSELRSPHYTTNWNDLLCVH